MKRRAVFAGGAALALTGAAVAYAQLRQMGSMATYDASVAETREMLSMRPEMRDLARYATLAPSGHNTQPWRLRMRDDRFDILPDVSRRTPIVDPDDHHLFVSLGCAAENLALAAGARGYPGEVSFNPENGGSVAFTFEDGPATESALFEAIPRRQSARADYDGRPVSRDDLQTLAAAALCPEVDLIIITDRARIERVGELVTTGNSAQLADPAFVRELKSWLRFSPRQAIATGDGLFTATSGNPTLPAWLGPHLFDWTFDAAAENENYARQLRSSPGIAVFVSHRDDPEGWVSAGRACQRFALQATALGLKLAFMNQPVEVVRLRPELARLVGTPGRRPDIVMRFGYGPAMPFSARRPMAEVLA